MASEAAGLAATLVKRGAVDAVIVVDVEGGVEAIRVPPAARVDAGTLHALAAERGLAGQLRPLAARLAETEDVLEDADEVTPT